MSSRTGYEGKLLTLKEDKVALPDGSTGTREYVLHQGAAMVIPLFKDGSVLLERQFRYPLRAPLPGAAGREDRSGRRRR